MCNYFFNTLLFLIDYPLTIPTHSISPFSNNHDYDTQKRQQAASFPSQKHHVKQTVVGYQFRP